MKCPGCTGKIEKTCQYICRTCWPKVPAKDRMKLTNMHVKRIDVTSLLAKIARELRAKNGVILVIDDPKPAEAGIAGAVRLESAAPEIPVEIIEGDCHRER